MRKWFKDVKMVEELPRRYRALLKMYHSDNDQGSVEITQEISAEYAPPYLPNLAKKESKSDS